MSLFSSVVLSLLLYPFDTAKRCLQLSGVRGQPKAYAGNLDVFQKLLKVGGPAALYRGCHIYILREFLTAFAQLTIYDALQLGKVQISKKKASEESVDPATPKTTSAEPETSE